MKISDVDFDKFIAWMGYLEDNVKDSEGILKEAIECVPAVWRLMLIYHNAVENEADDIMLMRNRDIINVLISLYQLEKGKTAPIHTSTKKKSKSGTKANSAHSSAKRKIKPKM